MSSEAGLNFMNHAVSPRADVRNRLLNKLSSDDWALVAPHLEMVSLKERQVVEVPHKPITHVYFVETGVVSVVAVNEEDHRIEVGVIGNEGMTGVSAGHGRRPGPAFHLYADRRQWPSHAGRPLSSGDEPEATACAV